MNEPLPDPAGIIQSLLANLGTAAVERAWSLLAAKRGKRDPVGKTLRREFENLKIDGFGDGLDPEVLAQFLASPDLAGALDRLLAFRLLASQYKLASETALSGLEVVGTAPDQHRSNTDKAGGAAGGVGVSEGDLGAASVLKTKTYEGQNEALRRECVRIVELWFGSTPEAHAAGEAAFGLLKEVAAAAYGAIDEPDRADLMEDDNLRRWLNSVEPRLQFLDSLDSTRPFLEFENELRLQVAASHRSIKTPHLGSGVQVNGEDVYVEPLFSERSTKLENIPASEFTAQIDRTVVLGDPGAGKSSFSAALCHRVASRYEDRPVGGRLLTPILVTLREVAELVSERSIVEMLEFVTRTTYQVEPPRDAVHYLLNEGRLLIVFDGLDELREVSDRRRVRDALQAFCEKYPMTHVLITARNIGYEHSELNSALFSTYELRQFNEEQVGDYCRRWFSLQEQLTVRERELKTEAFLVESKRDAEDLRRNPLLLSLLCGVYAGEGSLPTSRPKIYQRCVDLLLGIWEELRQIRVDDPLGEVHLRRTLRQVAYWLYEDGDLNGTIPEKMLIRRCAAYLAESRTEDLEEAEGVAQSFVDFCRDRTWVLVQAGHDSSGEPLFGFAHGTFLEFFAAQYLEKQSRTPQDLTAKIKQAMRGSASVVPLLALQLADDTRDNAADEILTTLISDSEESEDRQEELLLYVVEALRFVVPRPNVTRRLARETALGLIRPSLVDTTRYDGAIVSSPWAAIAIRLAEIAQENIRAAAIGYQQGLDHAVNADDQGKALMLLFKGIDMQQSNRVKEAWVKALPETVSGRDRS
jgi:NACHT domain